MQSDFTRLLVVLNLSELSQALAESTVSRGILLNYVYLLLSLTVTGLGSSRTLSRVITLS